MEAIINRILGKLCREGLSRNIAPSWGKLKATNSWLISESNKNKILTLYSAIYKEDEKYFYGITTRQFEEFDNNSQLAFLMRDRSSCNYILLNPEESMKLLKKLNPETKRINIRIPSTGSIYIQEWPELSLRQRVVEIENLKSLLKELGWINSEN